MRTVQEPSCGSSGAWKRPATIDRAQGSDAGATIPQRTPDLPGKAHHRRLAVGTGHRGDDVWLALIKTRRQECIAVARIFVLDMRQIGVARQGRGPRRSEQGSGPVVRRVGDEPTPGRTEPSFKIAVAPN